MNPKEQTMSKAHISNTEVHALYRRLTETLIAKNLTAATMESCTGGLIASLLTDTEGASAVIRGGFVTYSNMAKIAAGVPSEVISTYGVYSKETACAMADACRKALRTDLGIGVTGTFGNADPANADSVPGIVYAAVSFREDTSSLRICVPVEKERSACKLFVAGEMARCLEGLLNRTT